MADTRAEADELYRRTLEGDQEARSEFVLIMMPMLKNVVRRAGFNENREDMLHEAVLAFLGVVDKKYPEVAHAILAGRSAARGRMIRCRRLNRSVLHFPSTPTEDKLLYKLHGFMRDNPDMPLSDIAKRFGVTEQHLGRFIGASRPASTSLAYGYIRGGDAASDDISIETRLIDETPSPEDRLIERSCVNFVRQILPMALSRIPKHHALQRDIIIQRLLADEPVQQRAIADQYGRSHQSVSQTEQRLVDRIRTVVIAAAMNQGATVQSFV